MKDVEDVRAEMRQTVRAAGLEGFMHARDLAADREVGCCDTTVCATASVGKVSILVSLMQAVAAGEVDLAERVHVADAPRTGGPSGLSVLPDPVDLSLRAVAHLMMTVSDNHATDIILDRLTPERVTGTMRSLGLQVTTLDGTVRDLYARSHQRMQGVTDGDDALRRMRSDPDLNPATAAWRTTPAEITQLLQYIWRDQAAPPALCAEMRSIMRQCTASHGLVSGFPAPLQDSFARKTGTLTGIRNEVGVVDYPDGGPYAVAVFTLADVADWKGLDPHASIAIGRAARLMVDYLRTAGGCA